jgi:hypothetical protein
VKSDREVPGVVLAGEIYVRSDPFANDFVAAALERRGLRVRLEPVSEFIRYSDHIARAHGFKAALAHRLERRVRERLLALCHQAAAAHLGWPGQPSIAEVLEAARPYIRPELEVETPITLGVPLHAWRRGQIAGAVNVGPLECMPSKIAESLFCHATEHEGLLSLSLALNGEPVDPEALDNFAFEVHERFKLRVTGGRIPDAGPTTPLQAVSLSRGTPVREQGPPRAAAGAGDGPAGQERPWHAPGGGHAAQR